MRVLVTGSREWHDSAEIRRALTEIAVLHPGEDITLVSGNAQIGRAHV